MVYRTYAALHEEVALCIINVKTTTADTTAGVVGFYMYMGYAS